MSSNSDTTEPPQLWMLRLKALTSLSPVLLGTFYCLTWILVFYLCGVFNMPEISSWQWTKSFHLQMLGLALFQSVITPYLFVINIYLIHLMEYTLDALKPQLDYDEATHEKWRQSFSKPPVVALRQCSLVGIFISLVLAVVAGNTLFHLHPVGLAILFSSIMMWVLIGQTAFIMGRSVRILMRLADTHLKVKLTNLEALTPFLHVGVQGVLLVAGALALMSLQAIDIQFRLINHLPGVIVGVPLAIAFLLLPIWRIHRRIVAVKSVEIAQVQTMLDRYAEERPPTYETIVRISTLMGYKQQLKALPTWPLELPDMYRLAFYLVIPPISWTGAALIQRWLG